MNNTQRDRLLAVVTLIGAASYVATARAMEDSLLSDAVGAGGVPQGAGWGLMAVAALLLVRTLGKGKAAVALPTANRWPQIARTTALVLILLAYAALLPWLGYTLSINLLVLASGWLAGAAFKPTLWAYAALSGPALWALFDQLLQVRMPVGLIWG